MSNLLGEIVEAATDDGRREVTYRSLAEVNLGGCDYWDGRER